MLKNLKIFTFDNFIKTVIVFAIMFLFEKAFNISVFEPLRLTLDDVEITDNAFSSIIERSTISADTNITLINSENISNRDLAALIAIIEQCAPKGIGIEKIINKDFSDPIGDIELTQIINHNKNIIINKILTNFNREHNYFNGYIVSDSDIVGATSTGHGNFYFDENKQFITLRTCLPIVHSKDNIDTAFSVKLAMLLNPEAAKKLLSRKLSRETINWKGTDKFLTENYKNIIAGDFDKNIFSNKLVLLGISKKVDAEAPSDEYALKDLYFTPLQKNSGVSWPDMYGLQVHANIISMIIEGNYFNQMPRWLFYLLPILVCYCNMVLFGFICDKFRDWYELSSIFIFVLESILLLFIMYYCFLIYLFELKVTGAIFACALSLMIFEAYTFSIKPIIFHGLKKINKGEKL
ncbi:MAG: CHASE2 domain-containing protein [Candidatus Kapabacteria bacterium]|nr:CHASE2 domain-containing protein [Candidatus Kapabacteria bacterium]